jgi:hypothetical protein
MNFESARMKALKLLALASRGVGGEAENARKMLEAHCAKHGINIATLADCERSPRKLLVAVNERAWQPKPCMELAQLAVQCLRYILEQDDVKLGSVRRIKYVYRRNLKSKAKVCEVYEVEADTTLAEWEDWRSCFDYYAPHFWQTKVQLELQKQKIAKALKQSLHVFINYHNLFPPDAGKAEMPTPEEIAAYQAAAAAVSGDKWERPTARIEQSNFYLQ